MAAALHGAERRPYDNGNFKYPFYASTPDYFTPVFGLNANFSAAINIV